MRTLNARLNMAGRGGLVALVALFWWCGTAAAQVVTSTEPAGFLVFPKVEVDTLAGPLLPFVQVDTLIQITNTDTNRDDSNPADGVLDGARRVHCFWVDATGICFQGVRDGEPCLDDFDCSDGGGRCRPAWAQRDFDFRLTPGQTIGFFASGGVGPLPCDPNGPPPGQNGCGTPPEFADGNIPAAGDPFRGELKCIEVAEPSQQSNALVPRASNSLIGKATVYQVGLGGFIGPATYSYNAIGVQADENASGNASTGDPADPMCLGTVAGTENCVQSYAGCPSVLVLNHYFEGAEFRVDGSSVTTRLTLVPCSEDLGLGPVGQGGPGANDTRLHRCYGDSNEGAECDPQNPSNCGTGACLPSPYITSTTAQMLIYNEFEQRFSTSRRVQCYDDVTLADIDTAPGSDDDSYSIFSAGVQGTLTGQTRIRGVMGQEVSVGHGLLGVAEEGHFSESGLATAAFSLNKIGVRGFVDGSGGQADKVCSGSFGSNCAVP